LNGLLVHAPDMLRYWTSLIGTCPVCVNQALCHPQVSSLS
jgi:hypothetical protein